IALVASVAELLIAGYGVRHRGAGLLVSRAGTSTLISIAALSWTVVSGQCARTVLVIELVVVVVVDVNVDVVIDLGPLIVGRGVVSVSRMVARIHRTVWRRVVRTATVIDATVAPSRVGVIVVVA